MKNLGLALSGGGFRATLYHLGIVRFLRDAGALEHVTDIASVSGGSIIAAHLVLNWERYNGTDDDFDSAASELIRFVKFDVRNHIVRRLPMQYPLRLLAKFHLCSGRNLTPNAILERYYRDRLYGDKCLYELPEQPMLHLLATNVSNGSLSVFNRNGLYIQERSNDGSGSFNYIPGTMASIPRVVGASSAFPGFFPPVEISAADLGVSDGQFPTEFFTDGGVYDNLSIRAFSWLKQQQPRFDQVLVSDAGKPFQILSDAALGVIGQSVRATDILWDRVWQLERENFGSKDGFLFLPMSTIVDQAADATVLNPVVQAEVQSIRTDLDQFSDQEINALTQHGYEVARQLCRQNHVLGDVEFPDAAPWAPVPSSKLPKVKASGESSREPAAVTQLARKLRTSSQRRIFSTLLDWRDWPSYIYLAIAILLFVFLPLQVYQLYQKSQAQSVIIAAIASGDPDIRQILNLARTDPTEDWIDAEIDEIAEPTKVSFDGVEILSHSRIYDLRRWYPDEEESNDRGHVYIRDRITVKLLDTYEGDGHVTFQAPSRAPNMRFRQPDDDVQGVISRVTTPIEVQGQQRTVYEFEYDFSQLSPEEPGTIEVELLTEFPKVVKVPFQPHAKTDLISVWILFPADRPYRTYSLVSYPADRSEPPRVMNNRYAIDHPYGSLIGWSVANPDQEKIYECRWTTD